MTPAGFFREIGRPFARRRVLSVGVAALLSGLAAGCMHPSPIDSARVGPFFQPRNYTGVGHLPLALRRVVLLPVHGGDLVPRETVENLDAVFGTALQRQQRFEVVALSRDECEKTFGQPDFSSAAALPTNFLRILADKFAAQGVMFIDLTTCAAYGPMALGIRAKLADVDTRGLVWTFDDLFTTGNPTVSNSLRAFYLHNERGSLPFDLSTDSLQSPSRFAAYAADAAFRTLPPP